MKVKALLYCTKAKPYLVNENDNHYGLWGNLANDLCLDTLNGTIPCECEIEVEKIHLAFKGLPLDEEYATSYFREKELLKHSCLSFDELDNYLKGKNRYALHISNLKVFDKPYKLGEALIYNWESQRIVEKAPQNMCNVWFNGKRYVLISVQPQWLCKILNGEKDIEIRKQVLNCMKGNE